MCGSEQRVCVSLWDDAHVTLSKWVSVAVWGRLCGANTCVSFWKHHGQCVWHVSARGYDSYAVTCVDACLAVAVCGCVCVARFVVCDYVYVYCGCRCGCVSEAASAGRSQHLTKALSKLLGLQELAANPRPELQRGGSVLLQEVCPPLPNRCWAGPLLLLEQAPPLPATGPELCAHPDAAKSPGADVAAEELCATETLRPDWPLSWTELWVLSQESIPQGTRFPLPTSQKRTLRPREGKPREW